MAKDITVALTLDDKDFNRKLNKSKQSVKDLGTASGPTTAGIGKLAAAFGGLVVAARSVAGAFTKVIAIQRQFDIINASLVTVTGSADNAARAFEKIQAFAANTPFDLAQVADAFVKLKAFGLDPSERALTSYGNTASAMGKSMNQMVEAVADAATMEFERLKEFGIKTKQEADKVIFTFRGVKTEVGKNAEEIQEFLLGLGEVEFAGAMAERAATLDGALSNLADSWDNLFLTISQSGIGGYFETTARQASLLVDEIARLVSGESQGALREMALRFKTLTESREKVANMNTGFLSLWNYTDEMKAKDLANIDRQIQEIEDAYAARLRETPSVSPTSAFVGPISPNVPSVLPSTSFMGPPEATTRQVALMKEAKTILDDLNELILRNNQEVAKTIDINKANLVNKVAELDLENSLFGLSESRKDEARELAGIEADRLDALAEISALQLSPDPIINAHLQKEAVDEINESYATQSARIRETMAANRETSRDFSTGWGEALANFGEDVKNEAAQAKQLFDTVTNGFTNAFVQFAETGKLSFKSLIDDVLKQLIKMQAQKAFMALFGGGEGGEDGLLTSFFSSILKKEKGGPVTGKTPYLVGEKGPELFVPSNNGNIVPNNQLGGGGTAVTYNINAVDAQSFKQLVAADPEFIYAVTRRGAQRV